MGQSLNQPRNQPGPDTNKQALAQMVWPLTALAPIIYLIHSLVLYGLSNAPSTGAFAMLGSWRIPSFYDLRWLLSFSACQGTLRELQSSNTLCHGYPWPGYPLLSMQIGRLVHLGPDDAGSIGILFGLAIIAIVAHQVWLFSSSIRSWAIITSLILLSFPLQMLLERANLDAVIYALTSLLCLLLGVPGIFTYCLINFVVAIAVGLKVYPVFGIASWLALSARSTALRRKYLWLNLSLIATTCASLVIAFVSINANNLVAGMSGGLGSHGLKALGYINTTLIDALGINTATIAIRGLVLCKGISFLIGILAALLLFSYKFLPLKMLRHSKPILKPYSALLLVVSTGTAIGCYLTSINYDYRLLFFMPILAAIAGALLDGVEIGSRIKKLYRFILLASVFIFSLPFLKLTSLSNGLVVLELFDEAMISPIAFGCLLGIWIKLVWNFDEWSEGSLTR
jgi:hypothetical protein